MKVGMVVPTTGSLQGFGVGMETATLLAQKEINDAGGLLGGELEIDVRDTQTNPDVARQEVEDLVNNLKVPAILGLLATPDANAAMEITVPNQVVTIVGGASHVNEAADDDFVFRTVPSIRLSARVLAKEMYDAGHRKIATLGAESNSYTNTFAALLREEFGKLGGEITAAVSHTYNAPSGYDYQADLDKAYAGTPDAIFLAAYTNDGVGFLSTWASNGGFSGQWYLADPLRLATVAETVGAAKVEGMKGIAFPPPSGAGFDSFKSRFVEQAGSEPGLRAWNQYDATIVLGLAIARAGKAEGPAIRDAMREVANPPGTVVNPGEFKKALELIAAGEDINYEGASGTVDFDDVGEVRASVEIWKFSGGQPVTDKVIAP